MSRSENSTPAEVVKPREYKKLNRYEDYDKEAASELAEAMNEAMALTRRLAKLQNIIEENNDLKPFVWTTADGVSKALHDIDDDHLKNILKWLFDRGQTISKSLRAEAARREIEIPESDYDLGVRLLATTPNYRSMSRDDDEPLEI